MIRKCRKTRGSYRELVPNLLTVATVGVITVADCLSGDVSLWKAGVWCVVWALVLAACAAGMRQR